MRRTLLGGALATPLAFGLACPALAQQISGTFSANMSGFQPTPTYSQLSVSNASSRVALPSGTTVVIYKRRICDGVTATTTAGDVIPPNSWMAFSRGPKHISCGDRDRRRDLRLTYPAVRGCPPAQAEDSEEGRCPREQPRQPIRQTGPKRRRLLTARGIPWERAFTRCSLPARTAPLRA